MPSSQETANSFMTGGRGDQTPEPWSDKIDVCYPQNAKVKDFDLTGGTKMQPPSVDYDPKPEVKNPRSVSDQNPEYDSEGK